MQAFSVSSKYISNLIARLNLTLVIVILAFTFNLAPISIFNATLPSTISEFYNAAWAISVFLVIVKPAFIKYLKETRKNLIKYIT
jgi:hypothetical protein